jgi:hypothetical protein
VEAASHTAQNGAAALADGGDARLRPLIFTCGSSRSGTSMMCALLGLGSRVFATTEWHFFEHLSTAADRQGSLTREAALRIAAGLLRHQRFGAAFDHASSLEDEAAAFLDERFGDRVPGAMELFAALLVQVAESHGKQIPCEQTPRNVLYLDEILSTFPAARAIVTVRDPRDVLASQKHKWKTQRRNSKLPLREAVRLRLNYHPITTSLLWNAAVRAGDHHAAHERVRIVRFEDVLAAPEQEVRAICGFLDLPYEDEMLAVPSVKSSFDPREQTPVGINASAAGRWARGALRRSEVYLCERITREGMERHGYEASMRRPTPGVALELATFPVKAGLAFFANRGRNRSMLEGIKRRFGS